MEHFADRLQAAVEATGSPVCVGLDPRFDRLPDELAGGAGRDAEAKAIEAFCEGIIDAVADIVPAVKIQSAYFERYGSAGVALYERMVARCHDAGLIVIGDVKRGDIGSTAETYAAAHLCGENSPDAITVNPYFGADGLAPFAATASREGKGVFMLVRTSNPSAAQVQDFADADGRHFYEHMAAQVAELGEEFSSQSGYSCVGAVVGATYPDEARRLRDIMPRQIFLVPGYGAQGASADDCAASFKPDGTGAIVNASRSVIYAFGREEYAKPDWREAVAAAAKDFATDIRRAVYK